MKCNLFFFTLLLNSVQLLAGGGHKEIKGTVQDENGNNLPGVVIILTNGSDSGFVAGAQSGVDGSFTFTSLDTGKYSLQVKYTGYEPVLLDSIHLSDSLPFFTIAPILLQPAVANLDVVSVVAEIPLFEYSEGKVIVNVEKNNMFLNSTLLEVLEKSPGVTISKDGGVLLYGRSDIIIAIDGKSVYVRGQELTNLLRSYQASSIMKIEITTHPPAGADAAGSGGMINIITKKNQKEGLNGSITSGYGQGVYPKSNVSFMCGYRTNRFAMQVNYTISARRGYSNLVLTRHIKYDSAMATVLTDSWAIFPIVTNSPRVSFDYTLTNRTSVAVTASGVHNRFNPSMESEALVYDTTMSMLQRQTLHSEAADRFGNWSLSGQLVHQKDSGQKKFTTDVEYVRFFNSSVQNQVSEQYNSADTQVGSGEMMSDQRGCVNIGVAKCDYSFTVRNDIKLETGIKSGFVRTDNDNMFYQLIYGSYVPDSLRTNHFVYEENINALYFSASGERKDFTWQGGIRLENTNIRGNEATTGQQFNRSYTQLFPSLEITYKISGKLNVGVTSSRRVDRPGYKFLNPFRYSIDAMSYDEGNPYLAPQTSSNIEFSVSLLNKAMLNAGFSRTENVISQFIRLNGIESNSTLQTYSNVGVYNRMYCNGAYSQKFFKRLSISASAFVSVAKLTPYDHAAGSYRAEWSWSSSVNTRFELKYGYSLEAGFKYISNQRDGLTMMRSTYTLGAGIQRVFGDGKAQAAVYYSDILYKSLLSGITQSGNVTEDWTNYRDTRVINLSFTYRFGNGKVLRTKRSGAADAEKDRSY